MVTSCGVLPTPEGPTAFCDALVAVEGGLATRCAVSPQVILDRFLADVFEGEAAVRKLMVRYVILQLLSDAAFCLERWEHKGGGVEHLRPLALEKWLWRAMWDIYIATEVVGRVLVEPEESKSWCCVQ